MAAPLDVPEPVVRKARAVGSDGRRWLDELGDIVARLEAEWRMTVQRTLPGGSGGYVATVRCDDGRAAVLKLAIPDGLEGHSPFALELETLRLGRGHGYVEVLRADHRRRAMLLERLGPSVAALALPVEEQIDAIAATLRRGWHRVPARPTVRTGADQAHWLHDAVARDWRRLDRPCPARVIDIAQRFAASRSDAFDDARAVLVHGDAHPGNVLEDPRGGFKLIDPDGMRSEPAHDLAIPLRDWTAELESGDPVALGQAWCARLGERAGVDPRPIWEWAFLERVSTGLFLLRLGDPLGTRFLAIADRWSDV